jgi:two-component system CheB/CheR fusion protein
MTARPQRLSALIVDDHEDSRAALAVLLQLHGVDVRTARDGEEAWREIVEAPPDLILCDLHMPNLDGFGFVRRLRADSRLRGTVTIAVSALGGPRDLIETREAGFDGHVVKPISEEALVRLLDRVRSAGPAP